MRDLLTAALLLEAVALIKTSANVKRWRRMGKDPEVAGRRLEQYARSLGLVPARGETGAYVPELSGDPMPNTDGNRIGYTDKFPLDHELGHAVMTPEGRTPGEYIAHLTHTSVYGRPRAAERADQDEETATHLESAVRRRAGLAPKRGQIPASERAGHKRQQRRAEPFKQRLDAGLHFNPTDATPQAPQSGLAALRQRAGKR